MYQTILVPTYYPEPQISQEIEQLDLDLHQHWQPGKFIWPVEWQHVKVKVVEDFSLRSK
ncbi:MAG: hypothetical protein Fur0044_48180 [Anaerolineae bacterium]